MKEKLHQITVKKEQEEKEEEKKKKMAKKDIEARKINNPGRIIQSGFKKKEKSLLQYQMEAHEAYQLLMSEQNRRLRVRMMQKVAAVNALKNGKLF